MYTMFCRMESLLLFDFQIAVSPILACSAEDESKTRTLQEYLLYKALNFFFSFRASAHRPGDNLCLIATTQVLLCFWKVLIKYMRMMCSFWTTLLNAAPHPWGLREQYPAVFKDDHVAAVGFIHSIPGQSFHPRLVSWILCGHPWDYSSLCWTCLLPGMGRSRLLCGKFAAYNVEYIIEFLGFNVFMGYIIKFVIPTFFLFYAGSLRLDSSAPVISSMQCFLSRSTGAMC